MSKITKTALAIILMATVTLAGCGQSEPASESTSPTSVTLVLDWVPNTNHTGFYVAQSLGYYRDAGLEVKIVQPSAGTVPQLISSGQGDFGVSYQEEVTMARAEKIPVKAIAAIIQHNTSGFASPEDKNIVSPADFANKIYGGWGTPSETATLKYLMEKNHADFSSVKIVNMGTADFFTSMATNADFSWIFYGWTGIEAEIKGIPLNYIELRAEDSALDYYTPVIIASESALIQDPQTARNFLEATSRGYGYAIANPEKAAQILCEAVPELDQELARRSQLYLAGQYQAEASRWGEMSGERWKAYGDFLYNNQLLAKPVDCQEAFSNDYLPAARP